MNERIKELAKSCGADIWVAFVNPDGDVNDQEKYEKSISFEPPEKLEEFVKAIVRECAEIADKNWSLGVPTGQIMKKYFGLE